MHEGGTDITDCIKRYEKFRKPRIETLTRLSYLSTLFGNMNSSVAVYLRDNLAYLSKFFVLSPNISGRLFDYAISSSTNSLVYKFYK